jgi:peptidoglycan/xylan/chitin deacetylase (PgdA/CDA1 family)
VTRPPIILLYHRVSTLDSDPWGICVSPENFAEQLAYLSRHFQVMSLSALVQALESGKLPRAAVVLTFDDGYSDNLYHGRPLLERFDAPATVFVTSGAVDSTQEFWWDELEQLLLRPSVLPSQLEIEIDGRAHRWALETDAKLAGGDQRIYPDWRAGEAAPTRRHEVYYSIYRLLRPLSTPIVETVMEQLRTLTGIEGSARESHRTLRAEELAELARNDLVEIGSHTVSHPLLSRQPWNHQKKEIEESKRFLEDVLERPVESLAYPHGGQNDFSEESMRLAREAGYSSACAAFQGYVSRGVDRFKLPRLSIGDWSGEELQRRLRFYGWL